MLTALNLEEPDIVPVAPYIYGREYPSKLFGLKISDYVLGDIQLRAKVLLNSYRMHRYDWVFAGMNEPKNWREKVRIEDHGNHYVVVPKRDQEAVVPGQHRRVGGWVVPKDNNAPQYVMGDLKIEEAVKQLSDIEDYESILKSGRCELIKLLSKKVGKEVLIAAEIDDAFGEACTRLGLSETLVNLYKKPNLMKKILRLINTQYVEEGKAVVEAGVEVIWLCTVLSGTDIISPKQFEEFALPYIRSEVEELRRLGVPVILYFCGDPMLILDKILTCNAGAYAFEENKKKIEVDLVKIKEAVKDRACLFGNFDAVHTLRGDPRRIEENVKEMIENVAPSGGFIMGTGSPVMYDTPPENIDAMISATRRFGRYPKKT